MWRRATCSHAAREPAVGPTGRRPVERRHRRLGPEAHLPLTAEAPLVGADYELGADEACVDVAGLASPFVVVFDRHGNSRSPAM